MTPPMKNVTEKRLLLEKLIYKGIPCHTLPLFLVLLLLVGTTGSLDITCFYLSVFCLLLLQRKLWFSLQ